MIAGSMVALVTPFDAQGRLDWDSLAKLVDFHLQEGTNAIVAVGTTGEIVARKLISKAKYHGFDNEPEAVMDVVNGKADAFIYDSPYNVVAVSKFGAGKLVYLDQPFTYEPLAFGLKKGDYDSINFINNFLHQIREDGTYQRIHDKWFKNTEWLKEME